MKHTERVAGGISRSKNVMVAGSCATLGETESLVLEEGG
jgi:hypothetical protein